MKTLFKIALLALIFSCGKKNSQEFKDNKANKQLYADSATFSNTYDIEKGLKNRNQLLPKEEKITTGVDLVNTPVFTGRVATQDDVKSGRALFSLDPKGKKHRVAQIKLPFYVTMVDGGKEVTAIIVQAEILNTDTIFGYKNGNGKTGMCTSAEFKRPW
ncbi:MAG: hypothetical protein N2167_04120 [Flavobacteriales bacterium]|nr:hypothetical protein [Flavobacteriales bacterium]